MVFPVATKPIADNVPVLAAFTNVNGMGHCALCAQDKTAAHSDGNDQNSDDGNGEFFSFLMSPFKFILAQKPL